MKPSLILKTAKRKGLNGIAITDHDTIKGALEVRKLNKDKNFEVIVGEEVTTEYGHLLVYYAQQQIPKGSLAAALDAAREQGAVVALAHPLDFLRQSFPRRIIRKYSKRIDAIETFNSRTITPFLNDLAHNVAKRLDLASIAGSDAHFLSEIGGAVTIFNSTLKNAIRRRRTKIEGSVLLGFVGIAQTFLHKNFF